MKSATLIVLACGTLAGNTAALAREHRTDMSESRYRPDHVWPEDYARGRDRHRTRHNADDEQDEGCGCYQEE